MIQHNDGQFFADVEGKKAVLDYSITAGVMDIYSTFTPPELRGKGLAEKLTLAAFEFAKSKGLKVTPTCPYVRDYFLPKHKEFAGIVNE